MGDAFPTTGIFRRGYGKDAVDEFFIDARHAYEGGLLMVKAPGTKR